jgi:hypothetical protein
VSLTTDTWTDDNSFNFMSITAHYINAPKENPQEWSLHTQQLALAHVEGQHTGKNLAHVLVKVVDNFHFRDKFCFHYLCLLLALT